MIFKMFIKITGLILLALVILIFISIYTQTGTNLLVRAASKYFIRNAEIGSVSGKLAGSVRLNDIVYRTDTFEFNCSSASFKLKIAAILAQRISVSDIILEKTRIDFYEGGNSLKVERITSRGIRLGKNSMDAEISWSDAVLYDNGSVVMLLADGAIGARGLYSSYKILGSLLIESEDIPRFNTVVAADGSGLDLDFNLSSDDFLGGSVDILGKSSFVPYVKWDASLSGSGIRIGFIAEGYDGSVDFYAHTAGVLNEVPEWSVTIEKLGGTYRGNRIYGAGSVERKENGLFHIKASAGTGSAVGRISGSAGKLIDLSWNIDIGEIGDFLPGIGGSVISRGRLNGPSSDPFVEARIDGERITSPQIRLCKAGIGVSGRKKDHNISIAILAESTTVEMRLAGGISDSVWDGKIKELSVSTHTAVSWLLKEPAGLTADKSHLKIEPFELRHNNSSFTGALEAKKDSDWDFSAVIREMPLSFLNPFLPENIGVSGTVDGFLRGHRMEKDTYFEADLTAGPGNISYSHLNSDILHFDLFRLSAKLKEDTLYVKAEAAADGVNSVDLECTVSSFEFPLTDQPIELEINADIGSLSFAPVFIPHIAEAQGSLTASVRARGSIDVLSLKGSASMSAESIDIPAAGIRVTGTRLEAHIGAGNMIHLEGEAFSNGGSIKISGSAPLSIESVFPVKLEINGQNFQILKTPQLNVAVSPSLETLITRSETKITGSLDIPKADIKINERASEAIIISDDVIVRGAGGLEPASAPNLLANLRINIISDISNAGFRGYGAEAVIEGRLGVKKEPGDILYGEGRLSFPGGRYSAYGQRLTIRKGQLIFSGDLENPFIEVEAIRTVGSVVAGIRLSGRVQDPVLTVFSEPPMTQSEALSYLVFGKSFGQADPEEGSFVLGAESILRLAQEKILFGELQKLLGVQAVELSIIDTQEGSYVVLSKSLSPRLTVSYGFSPFETGNTFKASYLITPRLALQTESGIYSGMDLLYTVQYDRFWRVP